MTPGRSVMLVLALSALGTRDARGQSGVRDLPPSFRSLAGVMLNLDSAASIRAKLGSTRERRIDRGRAYESWCYVAPEPQPRALLEQLLGGPSRSATDSLMYYFDAKEYLRIASLDYETWNTPDFRESCFDAGPPYANVAASVIVVLRDDRAVEFRIERYDQSIC